MTDVNFFKTHGTDKKLEKEGVEFPIGGAFFTCRRAGGSNRRYRAALSLASLAVRDRLESNDLDEQLDAEDEATMVAYSEAVVIGWRGVAGPNNEQDWPFTKENFLMLMRAAPDLWNEIRLSARSMAQFKAEEQAAVADELGNS